MLKSFSTTTTEYAFGGNRISSLNKDAVPAEAMAPSNLTETSHGGPDEQTRKRKSKTRDSNDSVILNYGIQK